MFSCLKPLALLLIEPGYEKWLWHTFICSRLHSQCRLLDMIYEMWTVCHILVHHHIIRLFSANDAITLYAFTTFEQYIESINGLLIFESSFMLKSKDTDHIFGGEVGSKVWHFPSSSAFRSLAFYFHSKALIYSSYVCAMCIQKQQVQGPEKRTLILTLVRRSFASSSSPIQSQHAGMEAALA